MIIVKPPGQQRIRLIMDHQCSEPAGQLLLTYVQYFLIQTPSATAVNIYDGVIVVCCN